MRRILSLAFIFIFVLCNSSFAKATDTFLSEGLKYEIINNEGEIVTKLCDNSTLKAKCNLKNITGEIKDVSLIMQVRQNNKVVAIEETKESINPKESKTLNVESKILKLTEDTEIKVFLWNINEKVIAYESSSLYNSDNCDFIKIADENNDLTEAFKNNSETYLYDERREDLKNIRVRTKDFGAAYAVFYPSLYPGTLTVKITAPGGVSKELSIDIEKVKVTDVTEWLLYNGFTNTGISYYNFMD